jgi:quercetin dioxygenase-like cupin family protein
MKNSLRIFLIGGVFICTVFAGQTFAAKKSNKQTAFAITPESDTLKWGPAPAFMPPGTELAVLQGDPSKKNSDVMIKFPAKSKIANHWHSSAERMVLTSGKLEVTYEGQEPIVMTPGSYAYGPAKHKHEASCQSETPCILFIAFEGPVDALPVVKK